MQRPAALLRVPYVGHRTRHGGCGLSERTEGAAEIQYKGRRNEAGMNGLSADSGIDKGRWAPREILWAGLTVPLLFPVLSPEIVAFTILGMVLLCLGTRAKPPLPTLVIVLVACGALFVNGEWWIAGRIHDASDSLAKRLAPIAEVAPHLLISRALTAFVLLGLMTSQWKRFRLPILANIAIPFIGYVAVQAIAFLRIADIDALGLFVAVYWMVLLVCNMLVLVPTLLARTRHQAVDGIVVAFALGLGVAMLVQSVGDRFSEVDRLTHSDLKIAVYTPQDGSNDVTFGSSLGAHGLGRIGLYGDLAIFARRLGRETLELASLDELLQHSCDVLVCPSLTRPLLRSEREAVAKFVTGGGSLVVCAEHTNLDDNASTLNALLAEAGIYVNFDTTHNLLAESPIRASYQSSELGRTARATPLLQHNRGASLEIAPGHGRPVLLGNMWLSDIGDLLAPDRAFMGDARLSSGDRAGDLVLMAEARYGKGKVFISGDSSVFLNQNLAYNARFIATLLTVWPTQPIALAWPWAALAGAIVFLIVVRALGRTRSPGAWYVCGLLAVVAGAFVELGEDIAAAKMNSQWQSSGVVVISTDENNVFDRDPFGDKSVTAVAIEAFRSGHLVEIGSWENRGALPSAVVVINPTICGGRTSEKLSAIARAGSHVVLVGGGDNTRYCELVKTYGFDVSQQPVGAVQAKRFNTYSAWAVNALPVGTDTLFAGDVVVGGTVSVGDGKVTVIADDGFLYSTNLEQQLTYDAANCAYVGALFGPSVR